MIVYLKLNGIEMCCTGEERWLDLLDRLPEVVWEMPEGISPVRCAAACTAL